MPIFPQMVVPGIALGVVLGGVAAVWNKTRAFGGCFSQDLIYHTRRTLEVTDA